MSSQSPEGANGETKKPKGEIECNYILIKNCDVYCTEHCTFLFLRNRIHFTFIFEKRSWVPVTFTNFGKKWTHSVREHVPFPFSSHSSCEIKSCQILQLKDANFEKQLVCKAIIEN